MLYRSRAPLRLGLAGGGTDVSPYSDLYGGAILNATINMYAYSTIIPRDDGKIILRSIDKNQTLVLDAEEQLEINGELDIAKGVYNRIVRDYAHKPLSFELITHVDAPAGSGLGSSSTLTVTILGAFNEWLKLAFGEYDLAHLAYIIERLDLTMSGGKQDQYAATFGGFNFMEFYNDDKVIVNPLKIKPYYINELEYCLLIYYTGVSRQSSKIIDLQTQNVKSKNQQTLDATHKLKEQAVLMKEAILKGELNKVGEILDFGWHNKKLMAEDITNSLLDDIYNTAKAAGALGGKISGAGGGGFMMFYCPNDSRYKVTESLTKFGGEFKRFLFTDSGLDSWKIKF